MAHGGVRRQDYKTRQQQQQFLALVHPLTLAQSKGAETYQKLVFLRVNVFKWFGVPKGIFDLQSSIFDFRCRLSAPVYTVRFRGSHDSRLGSTAQCPSSAPRFTRFGFTTQCPGIRRSRSRCLCRHGAGDNADHQGSSFGHANVIGKKRETLRHIGIRPDRPVGHLSGGVRGVANHHPGNHSNEILVGPRTTNGTMLTRIPPYVDRKTSRTIRRATVEIRRVDIGIRRADGQDPSGAV